MHMLLYTIIYNTMLSYTTVYDTVALYILCYILYCTVLKDMYKIYIYTTSQHFGHTISFNVFFFIFMSIHIVDSRSIIPHIPNC